VLLTPDPIVAQLLPMKFGPVENQPEGPARQVSLDEFQCLDPDFRFMLAVYSVEVRWRVIVIIHSDDDSEEDAERWHERRRSGPTLQDPAAAAPLRQLTRQVAASGARTFTSKAGPRG